MNDDCFQQAGIDHIQLINDEVKQHITVLDKICMIEQKKLAAGNALEYDIKMGWRPKSQITGPVPLSFGSERTDQVLGQKQNENKLLYLGYRPVDSFTAHLQFYQEGNKYPFHQFHLWKSKFIQKYFQQNYTKLNFQQNRQQSVSTSSNQLIFDSCFEGGNLDAVYYEQGQYRLLLRNDTNTRGHCYYYNFKVTCLCKGSYSFRIMNMSKKNSLYERGLKPYISVLTNNRRYWQQNCKNIKYGESALNNQFGLNNKFYALKFEYNFDRNDQQVQFCYGIPYIYSDLILKLNQIRFQHSSKVHISKLCHSLSGVQIPLLTIGGCQQQSNNSSVVVITGRVHPSETHSSHIIEGIIDELLKDSKESTYLRRNVIFKIIPMLNPDGVILGNTRTSFGGKDLNRKYYQKTQFVFPQIIAIKDYLMKCKTKYKDRLLFMIDIHAHSLRKNSFFYGPQYPIMQDQYLRCRMFPKMLDKRTDMFRYYSCKFRISNGKEHTARGYFNGKKIRTYTHETSIHCYYNNYNRQDTCFSKNKLNQLGCYMVQAIYDYTCKFVKIKPKQQIPLQIKNNVHVQSQDNNTQHIVPNYQNSLGIQTQNYNDSDHIDSQGADSQPSVEDLPNFQLQQLCTQIKSNRQQFCRDLLAQNDISSKQAQQISSTLKNCQKLLYRRQQLKQDEIIQPEVKPERIKAKINSNIRLQPQSSKRQNYLSHRKQQEYCKLSTVIFGSSQYSTRLIVQHSAGHKKTKKTTFSKKPTDKDKIVPVSCTNNNQTITKIHKIHKIHKIYPLNVQQRVSQQLKINYKKTKQQHPNIADTKTVMRLIHNPTQFSIVKQVPESILILHNDRKDKQARQIMNVTNSLKSLNRKKSIKATRKSIDIGTQSNKMRINQILTTKLPSLDVLYTRY